MTILKQSVLAGVSAVTLAGSRFAFAAILARCLSTPTFGQFIFCQWLIEISILVTSVGATAAASRYFAEFRGNSAQTGAFLSRWRLATGVLPMVAGLGALLGLRAAGIPLSYEAQACLIVWAVTASVLAAQSAALTGLQKFDVILKGNLFSAAVLLAGATWISQMSITSMPWLFGVMALANFAALLLGRQTLKRMKSEPGDRLTADEWKMIRRYALNMWLVALLGSLVWSRGELPIVRLFHGDIGVAGYAIALTLLGGVTQGVMLGVSAVAPEITLRIGSGRQHEADALARSVLDLQLLACGALAVLLITLAPELIRAAFGVAYLQQAPALGVLALGLISMALSTQNHILQIETHGRFNTQSTMLGLVLLVALSLALIPSLHTLGAAAARSTAMTLTGLLAAAQLWRTDRRECVSLQNLATTYSIATLALILCSVTAQGSLRLRLLVLLVSLLGLAWRVRNVAGKPKIAELGDMVLTRVRSFQLRTMGPKP